MNRSERVLTKALMTIGILCAVATSALQAETITFNDLALATNSYFNGPTAVTTPATDIFNNVLAAGTFASGSPAVLFTNENEPGYWTGISYSNVDDTTTAGYTNQYAADTGVGAGPGVDGAADNYAIVGGYLDQQPTDYQLFSFDPTDTSQLSQLPHFQLPSGYAIQSLEVTNTTYDAIAMLTGNDGFGETARFGANDFFTLSVYGTNAAGTPLANHVDFSLASGTNVLQSWATVDLSALSGAATLYFNLSSSQVDPDFGMQTPGYFAMDNIQITPTPEPSSLVLLASAAAGLFGAARRRRSVKR